jgi:hypothetical protein
MTRWLFNDASREHDNDFIDIRMAITRLYHTLVGKMVTINEGKSFPDDFICSIMKTFEVSIERDDFYVSLKSIQILGHLVYYMKMPWQDILPRLAMQIDKMDSLCIQNWRLIKIRKIALGVVSLLLLLRISQENEIAEMISKIPSFDISRALEELSRPIDNIGLEFVDKTISEIFQMRCMLIPSLAGTSKDIDKDLKKLIAGLYSIFFADTPPPPLRHQAGYMLASLLFEKRGSISAYESDYGMYNACLYVLKESEYMGLVSSSAEILSVLLEFDDRTNLSYIQTSLDAALEKGEMLSANLSHSSKGLCFQTINNLLRFFTITLKRLANNECWEDDENLYRFVQSRAPICLKICISFSEISMRLHLDVSSNYLALLSCLVPVLSAVERRKAIATCFDEAFWHNLLVFILESRKAREANGDPLIGGSFLAKFVIEICQANSAVWFSDLCQVWEKFYGNSETFAQQIFKILFECWISSLLPDALGVSSPIFVDSIMSLLAVSDSARRKIGDGAVYRYL